VKSETLLEAILPSYFEKLLQERSTLGGYDRNLAIWLVVDGVLLIKLREVHDVEYYREVKFVEYFTDYFINIFFSNNIILESLINLPSFSCIEMLTV
jgi:hypothetical protein